MNEQNPGDWPDAVHMAATLSRAAHAHMQKRGLACCPHDIGLALWRAIAAEVAAREAAARREGIQAVLNAADQACASRVAAIEDAFLRRRTGISFVVLLKREPREVVAAIRALLGEGGR